MSEVKVSVVIPTLNNEATLERCLASIKSNNGQYDHEVVVVDGGSTDRTVQIAKKYADRVLVSDTYYCGTNRNKGINSAKGDIICFTDSDCIVPPTWIETLVSGLFRFNQKDGRIVGTGGGNIPLLENPSLMELAISKTLRSPLVAFGSRNVTVYPDEREVMHNPPMSAAYFKKVLEEVNGFSEAYAYGGEDLELDAKITERGYKLYYIPNCVVYHKHRSSFRKFSQQMYLFGRGKVRVGRRFKKYLPLHHYGPALLCLMTFSPLIFIPLGMGLANGACIASRGRNPKLFLPVVLLTMGFYVCYGAGEIVQFFKR